MEQPLGLTDLALVAPKGQLMAAGGDAEVELALEGAQVLVVLAEDREEVGRRRKLKTARDGGGLCQVSASLDQDSTAAQLSSSRGGGRA
ncbi:MAG TPA: hypothetical protein VFX14_02900 [Methylomirabilota bacterium]|nr:hypothetical protein [Methylomirabilota bacterium]